MASNIYVYDDDIRPIDRIDFSILGNREIANISAIGKDTIGIDIPDLYDNMEPRRGGLIDTRLGTTDGNIDCATCGLNSTFCVGHFGHITLSVPVFHMGYINFVAKILNNICLRCSKLLIYKNEKEIMEMLKNKSGKRRFSEIVNLTKGVTYCQKKNFGCGAPVSKIKIDIVKSQVAINIISETSLTNIPTEEGKFEGKKKIRQILTPEICYDILSNISDMDCRIMGFNPKKNRPEMMIYKIFPVPPVAVRPSVKASFMASSTREDDLTHKLADIIKSNVRIRKYKESINNGDGKYSQEHIHLLQYHVATFYNNDTLSIPRAEQRGKTTKSLSSRLKGKEGRIRGNLMGKRTDFSARTVITPDPTLDINQLGIPIKVATNLTFPEVVTPNNIDKLQKLVKNGRYNYPGANFVFPISSLEIGKRVLAIDLRYRKEKVILRYGDVVERHLVDDDYILLNRQPTLHKLSMMGHRIKVIYDLDLSTFRLPIFVTTPYNADFDGDEMNIFVPQSVQTQIELEEIADVKRQMITPASSVPIIGAIQDTLLGAYNLTAPMMKIDWKDAMSIISYATINDLSLLKKNKKYTGDEIFSMIIPPDINSNNAGLKLVNGNIIKGQLKKAHLGSKKENSIIHLIWDKYGMEETKKFLDNTQRLINSFNLLNGFTVGIGDIDIEKKLEDDLHKLFENKSLKTNHLITEMENNPDLLDADLFEESINEELNKILGDVSKLVMNNLKPDNKFNIMISSGSKGSPSYIGQMVACIGQQNLIGKRIPKKVNDRSLPYLFQNDDSAFARGFIEEPFLRGAHPISFIFHNMASREGLIDTAIKSVTGDTPIIILDNDKIKWTLIGNWIDCQLKNREKVKFYKKRNMELLELDRKVYIPTTDNIGNISWGIIKNITRHDPGYELYKIKTLGGRKVIVTESKSLLIWNNKIKKFEKMDTPNVKIGDYVPVTMLLPKPPIVSKYIDVINYVEQKYIKSSLIPEKIVLNKQNGIFIGAFLASGIINNSLIQFFPNNREIRDLIKNWFHNLNMEYIIDKQKNIIVNSKVLSKLLIKITNCNTKNKFIFNEAFLASNDFIIGLLNGYFSENCLINKDNIQILSSSKRLLIGMNILLSRFGIFGMISKIKNLNNNSKEYKLSIVERWITKFIKIIKLINNDKNNKLKKINNKLKSPTNIFSEHNDVILDKIISIDKINIKKYPKVYDLTIPDTLNFGLANGLQVVDTAESGYIQRKLVKSLEDAIVKYDLTVRNGNETIIQFAYGDDGVNSTKQFGYKFKIMSMGNKELESNYKFTKQEIQNYPNFSTKTNDEYYNFMLKMRNLLRYTKVKSTFNYSLVDNYYKLPVNFNRIVNSAKNIKTKNNTKLNPNYILEKLDDILKYENTKVLALAKNDIENDKSLKFKDEMTCKTILKIALHEILAPKISIFQNKFNKEQFDIICEQIISDFNKSIIEPGEIVGTLAAQSIGEPVTQMSQRKDTMVTIVGDTYYRGTIGYFIDNLLKERSDQVIDLGNDHVILNLIKPHKMYNILGVGNNEKTTWNKILQISRHPTNGNLIKITTKSGKMTTSTLSHSFLKRKTCGITKIKGSDLKIGDRIPIAEYIPIIDKPLIYIKIGNHKIEFNNDFGWFCGTYLAKGNLNNYKINLINIHKTFINNTNKIASLFDEKGRIRYYKGKNGPCVDLTVNHKKLALFLKDNFGCKFHNKKIPGFTYATNLSFIKGLLKGYFDGNSNIDITKNIISCSSKSKNLIESLCLLLAYCRIFANVKIKNLNDDILFTLEISKNYVQQFKDSIGTNIENKIKKLNKMVAFNNAKITSDEIDEIPELGEIIAKIGHLLKLSGENIDCNKWKNKAIDRNILQQYIKIFKKENKISSFKNIVDEMITILEQAVNGDIIWDEIIDIEIIIDPKEYVYDFTVPGNDSFMVDSGIFVHNTLNSIDWEEKICILENNKIVVDKIGNYIDKKVEENKHNISCFGDNFEEEMGDTKYIDVKDKNILTISVDENGKTSWNKIQALTKHLPINKDGTNDLIQIRTKSGRSVKATKAKSFLIIKNNKLIPTRGDKIKMGDFVPIVKQHPKFDNILLPKIMTKIHKLFNFNKNNKELNDIYYDEIIDIKIVQPTNKYVYDMTVENDKTFMILNGLLMYDTFHHAGIGAMGTTVLGVPRIKELLSFSKNMKTPIMMIYLKKKYRTNKILINKIASYIKHTLLRDIRDKADIYYDPFPSDKDGYMAKDNVYNVFYSYNPSKYSCQTNITNLPFLIRIELNKEEMMNKNITLLDIKSGFCNYWENRYKDTRGLKKEEKLLLDKITQCSILSNNDNDRIPIVHIRFDMSEFNLSTLINFLDIFIDNFKLKGFDGINEINAVNQEYVMNYNTDNHNPIQEKQFAIYTAGINLIKLRYINGIDLNKSMSNDVVQIYRIFGIEAARTALLKETKTVFAGAGNYINFQHLSILVDIMTNNGTLISIDRNGLKKLDTPPLAKASYEKTVDQLLTAAVFSETDYMTSVSSRIMAGLAVKGGTGLFDVVVNTELLENSEYIEDIEHKYKKIFNELTVNPILDDVTDKDAEDIFIPE